MLVREKTKGSPLVTGYHERKKLMTQDATRKDGLTEVEFNEMLQQEHDTIANAPASIETATKGKGKIKQAKKVAEEKPEPEPFTMFKADPEVDTVCLSDLVTLDSVPVNNGVLAMREINKQHVDHMVESLEARDQLPPLSVVNTNYGMVCFDGLHRWAAYETYLRNVISTPDADGNPQVDGNVLEEARKQFFVPATEYTITSDRELLQQAFEANLKHGLPASDSSRARFALYLYKENQENLTPISIREAARRARVSHVAVIKLQARIAKSQRKMIDVTFAEEDQQELDAMPSDTPTTEVQKELAQADKHMKAVLKAIEFFADSDITSTEMHRFVESYASQTSKENVVILQNEVRSLLSYVYDAAPHASSPEQKELLQA